MEEALTHGEPLFGVLIVTTVLHLIIGPVLVSGIQRQKLSSAPFPGPWTFTLFCIDINIPCVPLEMQMTSISTFPHKINFCNSQTCAKN